MTESKALQTFKSLQGQFAERESEFARQLPSHIKPHVFTRVALTAIQNDPQHQLLFCSPASIFNACIKCAQDGLLPDGREAALVAYKGTASYLPMVAGIRKKAWNSGELASWEARLVHENDEFEIVLGLDERVHHKPALSDRGRIVAVYSVAKFKSGFVSFDWMTRDEVRAIQQRAQTQRIWQSDEGEMVKKTMLKRHAKALPLSAEMDRVMQREDDAQGPVTLRSYPVTGGNGSDTLTHYDDSTRTVHIYEGAGALPAETEAPKKRGRKPRLADVKEQSVQAEPATDEKTPPPEDEPGTDERQEEAYQAGYNAYYDGGALRPVPPQYRIPDALHTAFQDGWRAGEKEERDLDERDASAGERT